MKIYLDTCCYNRPFDDQTQERIRIETISIEYIFNRIDLGLFELISSDVLEFELKLNPDELKRELSLELLNKSINKILLNDEIINHAKEIERFGFNTFDALHISTAIYYNVDKLLTTDDKMIAIAQKNKNYFKIKIENPIEFIKEYL
jgi:predicted nucleic acid-binding protein